MHTQQAKQRVRFDDVSKQPPTFTLQLSKESSGYKVVVPKPAEIQSVFHAGCCREIARTTDTRTEPSGEHLHRSVALPSDHLVQEHAQRGRSGSETEIASSASGSPPCVH
eukprot:3181887-Rhodomonas_salina.1